MPWATCMKDMINQRDGGTNQWLRPRRWIELVLLSWAIGIFFYYYSLLGYIDLLRDLLSR